MFLRFINLVRKIKRNNFYLKCFILFVIFSNLYINAYAQSATNTLVNGTENAIAGYNTNTSLDQARKQCRSVINTGGISAAFDDNGNKIFLSKRGGGVAGGGGRVPVYDTGVIGTLGITNDILKDIYSLQVERNFAEDCFKALSYANSIAAVKLDLKKTVKKITERGLQSPSTAAERAQKKILEESVEIIRKGDNPQKEAILEAISIASNDATEKDGFTKSSSEVDKILRSGAMDYSDINEIVVRGNNPEAQGIRYVDAIRTNINSEVGAIYKDAAYSGGIVGGRICTKTKSGKDPEEIDGYDSDCAESEAEPVLINQEKIKQLVNAPYNQVFSPAGSLGLDGGLANINTRINNGSIFSKDVNDNFGKGNYTPGGLIDAGKVKEALIATSTGTVSIGIEIQKALTTLYTSSTSTCRFVPIVERAAALSESANKRIELENYKTDLETKWKAVLLTPSADWNNLFIKLNLDLSQKYNKEWLIKLIEDARDKLTKCKQP